MSLLVSSMLYVLSLSTVTTFNNASDSSNKHEYEYYMHKSKNQRNAGIILMAVGIVGVSATLTFALLAALGDALITIVSLGTSQPKEQSYTFPLLVFGAVAAIGLTLLLASVRNKKKAKNLSLDVGVGNTSLLQKQDVKHYAYPALSLKIRF